jgi:hypothetical protein
VLLYRVDLRFTCQSGLAFFREQGQQIPLHGQFQTTYSSACRASNGVLRLNTGEYARIQQNTTNRPLLVFLTICSTTCTQVALLASFLEPFSMHLGSSKRCFRDCRSILRVLRTLLEMMMVTFHVDDTPSKGQSAGWGPHQCQSSEGNSRTWVSL